MIDFTLAEIAAATNGTLTDSATPNALVGRVCIDSREVQPGDLFVAIVGENHDAHDHVEEAISRGARAALVSRPVDTPAIVVGDTVHALGLLARALVDRLPSCTIVAVTGSSGKTSTKDLIATVLRAAGPTVSPPGSFNNEIGLPLTVLSADRGTRFLVLEMGMRGLGHIDYLCTIAPPDIAVVTNVGSAHLELLGSREGIATAKSEIVRALGAEGTAVLNNEDDLVRGMQAVATGRVLTFGESEGSGVRAVALSLDDQARATFTLSTADAGEGPVVRLRLHGRHHVSNALAAAAVGVAAGVPLAQVASSLSAAEPASRWRMEVVRTAAGPTIINDAYNANPESMEAALQALTAMAGPDRRSCAVLGEMREIGAGSTEAHAQIGARAVELGVNRIVAVGEGARPIADAARAVDPALDVSWVPSTDDAVELLVTSWASDDVILVKASRSIGLERVAVALSTAFSDEDGSS